VGAILEWVAREVDWEFVGSAHLAYARTAKPRNDVADFFAMLGLTEDFHVFDPYESIEASEHVTLRGYGRRLASTRRKGPMAHGVQVFTVKEGKITRPRGFANTAALTGYSQQRQC